MEQLRNNETGPVIDREKLLIDSQEREINRLFGVLESDRFSLFDVEDTLIKIGENNPKARPYIAQFVSTQKSSLEGMLMQNANIEVRENPETTKKLNLYQNLTKDLQKSLNDIQNSLNQTTSLSLRAMDNVVGLFTDDTVFNTYNSSFENIKNQAKNILWRVQEIDINSLTKNQKEVYNKTISELKQILSLKLESTGFIQMVGNEIDQIPQNLNYTAHAIKGEVIGLYEGGKAIITGSIDLLTFMVKYPFNSKYRQEVNKQAEIIYDFVKKEGLSGVGNKVYEAIGKEMDRISKLPPEKQSQAIGEIAGNVISMLAVIKVGTTVASKLGKVGKAESLIAKAEAVGNTARAEKIREIASSLLKSKRGLQSFEIILTGVAESVLLKGLSVSFKATLGFLENAHLSSIKKAELIEGEIIKAKQLKPESVEEKQILERYIETLNKEKESLQRIDNLYNNPRYKFLEKYKEVLGENISVSDIVGEGTQAIIMKHPTNDRLVLKIAKPGEVDDIMQEFKNHNLFYEKWLELSYNGKIDKSIKVPQVLKGEVDGYFYMEKVDGQSLYSKTLIERYEKQLSTEELKTIGELDDKQVREFLKKRFKETDSYLDQIIEDYSIEHLLELMGNTYKIRKETGKIGGTPLDNAITSLRESGVIHNDLHPGNIMIDREGNIYIIDFGRIREFNK